MMRTPQRIGLVLGLVFGCMCPALHAAEAKAAEKTLAGKKAVEPPAAVPGGKEKAVTLDPKEEIAVIETALGSFKLRFYPDAAPKAVENFKGLAKKGYYNGVIFHRVIDGFMIQGGDPEGTGSGGQSIWGKPFGIETAPKYKFNRKGLLAMAKTSDPISQGSQFFITLGACTHLDGQYTIFGEVVSGMDLVEKIGKAKKGPQDRPVEPVAMKKVTLTTAGAAESGAPAPKAGEGKAAQKVEPKTEGKVAPKAEKKT